jgi:predicted phosphoadenosine phosphosulfate sulfurtransferase
MRLPMNVLEAATKRIRWVYDRFDGNVVVGWSGGKDSVALLHLVLQSVEGVVRVVFVDQEVEWESTVRLARATREMDRVDFHWVQTPFRLYNASVGERENWLNVWGEGEEWMRPKEPVHRLVGKSSMRFIEVCDLASEEMLVQNGATLLGMRAQESPLRGVALTSRSHTLDGVTWGRQQDLKRGLYTFSPLYDWEIADVWKFIHDSRAAYNTLYDAMMRHNVPLVKMRCSSMSHETALANVKFMAEVEPGTWSKLQQRLAGINGARHLKGQFLDTDPPRGMSHRQYYEYLLKWYILDDGLRSRIRANCAKVTPAWRGDQSYWAACVKAILTNDYDGKAVKQWQRARPEKAQYHKRKAYAHRSPGQ